MMDGTRRGRASDHLPKGRRLLINIYVYSNSRPIGLAGAVKNIYVYSNSRPIGLAGAVKNIYATIRGR